MSPRLRETINTALNMSATPWLMLLQIIIKESLSTVQMLKGKSGNTTAVSRSRKEKQESEKRIHIEPLFHTDQEIMCAKYKGNIFLHCQGVSSLKR